MYKFLLHSKKSLTAVCIFLSVLPLTLFASCAFSLTKPYNEYAEYVIRAANPKDGQDVKWRDYLKNHLQRRAVDVNYVYAGIAQDDSQLQIVVDYDPNLKMDFDVAVFDHTIQLKARTTEAMLWLQYQFMSDVSSADSRFAYGDLPPAIINCRRDTSGCYAFEYRSVYSPTNADPDMMPIYGLGNVDFDWGLWGHNIAKIFSGKVPNDAKAVVDGQRSEEQFCFSSEELFEAYVVFITNNYGDGTDDSSVRFAVMPNDNDEVCLCNRCRKSGNTKDTATPSVTNLIERLAKRFPHHMFFTSAYNTTKLPTNRPLPKNAGVIISAMDLPFAPVLDDNAISKSGFLKSVNAWQHYTDRIYVWDYMRNFDDYITPFPCLYHLQNRLKLYKRIGVKGVFFNGSGYDYSSFDDVQTYTLAQLTVNPDVSIENCVRRYFNAMYPATGNILCDYYLDLERKAKGYNLHIYAGIDDALKSYLDAGEILDFCDKLDRCSKGSSNIERKKLNEMLTALAYTKLELLRHKAKPQNKLIINEQIALLSHHGDFENLANYRESEGDLDNYIHQWKVDFPWMDVDSKIRDEKLVCATPEDGQDITVLTDRKHGFITDYHSGWFIFSAKELHLTSNRHLPENTKFVFSFLHAPEWRIYTPSTVEIFQGDEQKGYVAVNTPQEKSRVIVPVNVKNLKHDVPVEIVLKQTSDYNGKRTVACDEIIVE